MRTEQTSPFEPPPMAELDGAYEDGWSSAVAGALPEVNPYVWAKQPFHYDAWEAGYIDACRLYPVEE